MKLEIKEIDGVPVTGSPCGSRTVLTALNGLKQRPMYSYCWLFLFRIYRKFSIKTALTIREHPLFSDSRRWGCTNLLLRRSAPLLENLRYIRLKACTQRVETTSDRIIEKDLGTVNGYLYSIYGHRPNGSNRRAQTNRLTKGTYQMHQGSTINHVPGGGVNFCRLNFFSDWKNSFMIFLAPCWLIFYFLFFLWWPLINIFFRNALNEFFFRFAPLPPDD